MIILINQYQYIMEVKRSIFGVLIIITIVLIWKAMKFFWLKPKKIERCLRKQGINGNSYKPFIGDIMEILKRTKEALLKPINFSDDNLPRVLAFIHHTIRTHGKICFGWIGPTPWLILADPDKIKQVLTNYEDFRKPDSTMNKIGMVGLYGAEGDIWAKHRKIITPAFQIDKLKNVYLTMFESCSAMINSWKEIQPFKDGSIELDVWPFIENLSGDFISRAAFGSSYEQGKRIFDLQSEYIKLTLFSVQTLIPGSSLLPTKHNKRVKEITKEVGDTLTRMVEERKAETLTRMMESRKAEMEGGESIKNDLLGILLESNMRENEGKGLTTKEVVEECQLFYLAGSETSSGLLAWTLILLSKHPIWQDRARTEVLKEFGNDGQPCFDGLNRLKIVTMILYEVLRLYTPVYMLMRKVYEDIQLQDLLIPAGTEIVIPLCVVHQDTSLWGEDSKEFNPERFSKGVNEATKGEPIYFPFSAGPRTCIGKNFALLEAKLVLSMILQRYSFELSPMYVHAPFGILTMQPQHGANLILTQLHN